MDKIANFVKKHSDNNHIHYDSETGKISGIFIDAFGGREGVFMDRETLNRFLGNDIMDYCDVVADNIKFDNK